MYEGIDIITLFLLWEVMYDAIITLMASYMTSHNKNNVMMSMPSYMTSHNKT
jgi:hypothetical protein